MPRKGPIRFPDPETEETELVHIGEPVPVELPPRHVLDAGVAKFLEMSRLHWPAREAGVSKAFDVSNERQLRMALGLTYMAMRDADVDKMFAEVGEDEGT